MALKTYKIISGVAGGTASGKSTVCKRIIEKLGQADINERQRQVRRKLFVAFCVNDLQHNISI